LADILKECPLAYLNQCPDNNNIVVLLPTWSRDRASRQLWRIDQLRCWG